MVREAEGVFDAATAEPLEELLPDQPTELFVSQQTSSRWGEWSGSDGGRRDVFQTVSTMARWAAAEAATLRALYSQRDDELGQLRSDGYYESSDFYRAIEDVWNSTIAHVQCLLEQHRWGPKSSSADGTDGSVLCPDTDGDRSARQIRAAEDRIAELTQLAQCRDRQLRQLEEQGYSPSSDVYEHAANILDSMLTAVAMGK